jgi:hypothetical protein
VDEPRFADAALSAHQNETALSTGGVLRCLTKLLQL